MDAGRSPLPRDRGNTLVLWLVFGLVHAILASVNLLAHAVNPIGDLRVVYLGWAESALAGRVPGIDGPFVYPVLAMVPIALALSFGATLYAETWLVLVFLLDAVALAALVGPPRIGTQVEASRRIAGWWWVAFLAALGPISASRIDAVTVPLAIVALLLAGRRPIVASALLTAATWIKVWPAAAIAALVIASRHRVRVLVAAILGSGVIVGVVLIQGGGAAVFSFLGEQAARGLQIEAPVSTAWMWRAWAGVGDTVVYYDRDILTFQVSGAGTALAASVMTPLMAIAVLAVASLGARAVHRGIDAALLLPLLTLAFVLALIVFNKVGSPQFVCWLAAPIILGIVSGGAHVRVPAITALVCAAMTQCIYPWLYGLVYGVEPAMLVVLSVRNLTLVGLFVWCIVQLWKAGYGFAEAGSPVGAVGQADRDVTREGK